MTETYCDEPITLVSNRIGRTAARTGEPSIGSVPSLSRHTFTFSWHLLTKNRPGRWIPFMQHHDPRTVRLCGWIPVGGARVMIEVDDTLQQPRMPGSRAPSTLKGPVRVSRRRYSGPLVAVNVPQRASRPSVHFDRGAARTQPPGVRAGVPLNVTEQVGAVLIRGSGTSSAAFAAGRPTDGVRPWARLAPRRGREAAPRRDA
jgi:hypothetical protein